MTNEHLIRGIGRWSLIAIIINSVIGAGIFYLPSEAAALAGSYSLAAILVCAIIIGLIMLCFAELSSRFSSTGGPYLYAREAFGPVVAFEVGWLSILVRTTSYAVILNIFVIYAGFFWSAATEPTVRICIVGIVLSTLTAVNVIGVRQSAVVTNLITVAKILALFMFVAAGLFFVQSQNFMFYTIPDPAAFSNAVLKLIFAFFGFEMALVPTGEVKDPKTSFPSALLSSLVAITVIYCLVQFVSIGTLPGLAKSARPLADAAGLFIGPLGAALIAAGALISILGNVNVGLLAGSRLLFAMSESGEIPAIFSRVHKRFQTPVAAIVFTSLMIFVITIFFSFLTVLLTSTITRLLIYATSCVALIVFRRRSDIPKARFSIPFGLAVAMLSLLLIGWLITNVDFTQEGQPILIMTAIGMLLYFANQLYRNRTTA